MRIAVNLIDRKGFYHRRTAKSKKLLRAWVKRLAKGTSVYWHENKAEVTISQQYCEKR